MKTKVLFAERTDEKLTFVFSNQNMKKVFTTTHSNLREYEIPEIIKEFLIRWASKIVISESGDYVFYANEDA